MSVYCNNFIFDETSDEYILFHEPGDSYQSWQGLRGPYYTPSVDPIGNLSWTNNGNLPNPATVNVAGRGITLKGVCATTADLPADPEDGEAWAVGAAYPYECYVWFENSWVDMGPLLPKGDPGEGVPAGGTTGQVLKKASNADYDTEWGTGGGSQVQADWTQVDPTDPSYIQHKPTIPAAQVQSDWNQADNTQVDYIKNKPTIPAAQVNSDWDAVSGVAQILNKPSIPVIDNTLSNTGEAADAKATGDKITDVEKITSYVENGNTASRNYTAGEYITWKGVAYYAKTNISSGASFVVDTNLTAVGDKGIANDLKNSLPKFIGTTITELYSLTSETQYSYTIPEDGWYFAIAENTSSGACSIGMWNDYNRNNLIANANSGTGSYIRATIGPIPFKKGAVIVVMATFTYAGKICRLS